MGIEHYGGNTAWDNDTRKFRKDEHSTFNMHMPVNQRWSEPASLQVALLLSAITAARCTDANNKPISESHIGGITFTTTHIYQSRVA